MKKLGFLILAAVSLLCIACQPEDKKDNVPAVSATFRFVASEDFQKLYDTKCFWSCEGVAESNFVVKCNDELDKSFVFTNNSYSKDLVKAGTFTFGSFTKSTTVCYRLTITRNNSVRIDPEKKYNICFGQDLTTVGEDKVSSTESRIFGYQGVTGEKVEEIVDLLIRDFFEEDKYADISL